MKGRRNERGKECGSATRPARIIQEEDFIMKKASKRAISLLLTLTLMFSAVMMFPSTASAEYPKAFSLTYADGTFSGSVSLLSKGASATTKFTSMTGLTVSVRVDYQYRDNSTGVLKSDYNTSYNSNASTAVTAPVTATPPNRGIFSKLVSADGTHTGRGPTQYTHIAA